MDMYNGSKGPDYRRSASRQNTPGYRSGGSFARSNPRERDSEQCCGCQTWADKPQKWEKDSRKDSDCGCISSPSSSFPWGEQFPPAMAYVPMQQFKDLYDMEKGLQRGTIFSQIDLPFEIGFCARGCGCS